MNEVCSSSQFHFFHHQLSFSVLHSFQLKFKLKYSLTYTSVHCVDFFFCSHVCYYFITMEEVDCQTASLSQYKIVALQQHSILWGNWSYTREFSEKKSVNYEIYNLCNYPFALSHWQVHGQSTSYQLVAFQHGYL